MLITSSQSLSEKSSAELRRIIPALLKRKSIFPNSSTARSTRFLISSIFDTSAWTGITGPPNCRSSRAVSSNLSLLRPAITISAPACTRPVAMPFPIPDPPPVTIPLFPFKLNFSRIISSPFAVIVGISQRISDRSIGRGPGTLPSS